MGRTAYTVEQGSVMYECAMCRAPVMRTEKEGLGYCEAHWRVVHPQRLRRLVRAVGRRSAPTRVSRVARTS